MSDLKERRLSVSALTVKLSDRLPSCDVSASVLARSGKFPVFDNDLFVATVGGEIILDLTDDEKREAYWHLDSTYQRAIKGLPT